MNIRLRLYGVFRSAANASDLELELAAERPTVRAAIHEFVSQPRFQNLRQLLVDSSGSDPRPNALIMVSGKEINTLNGLDTALSEGDELTLLPIVHGG
jgi:molybdopterin converting factor small subunit